MRYLHIWSRQSFTFDIYSCKLSIFCVVIECITLTEQKSVERIHACNIMTSRWKENQTGTRLYWGKIILCCSIVACKVIELRLGLWHPWRCAFWYEGVQSGKWWFYNRQQLTWPENVACGNLGIPLFVCRYLNICLHNYPILLTW